MGMFAGMMKKELGEKGQGIYEAFVYERLARAWEFKFIPMVDNFSWLKLGGIGERALTGRALWEPLGSTRSFLGFNQLMFLPAQVARMPLEDSKGVNTRQVIGPNARKPMTVDTPIILAAMDRSSVAKEPKLALDRAATAVGTAANSGETGFWPEERRVASKYIVQYNRAHWNNTPEQLAQADMVEVKVGQAAHGSVPWVLPENHLSGELADFLDAKPGKDGKMQAQMPARFEEIKGPEDFRKLVDRLRGESGGAPIGLKIAAGDIEGDLQIALDAGFDAVTLDGGQGGTGYGPEMTINNFGVPTLYAIPRARRFLDAHRSNMTLIATGGLRDSGDFLKALALGADAVAVGEAALSALMYPSWTRVPAWVNPMNLVFLGGKYVDQFDATQGARAVANFIKASTDELSMAAQTMGKNDVLAVNKDDLVALTEDVAAITGVKLAYERRTSPGGATRPSPERGEARGEAVEVRPAVR